VNLQPHVQEQLAISESRLKGRFKERVWSCEGCAGVLGVFSKDYTMLDIQAQRVHLTVSGGDLKRKCHRCETVNHLKTRRPEEDIDKWIADNQSKLARRK